MAVVNYSLERLACEFAALLGQGPALDIDAAKGPKRQYVRMCIMEALSSTCGWCSSLFLGLCIRGLSFISSLILRSLYLSIGGLCVGPITLGPDGQRRIWVYLVASAERV